MPMHKDKMTNDQMTTTQGTKMTQTTKGLWEGHSESFCRLGHFRPLRRCSLALTRARWILKLSHDSFQLS